jgi:hypothetical protein
MNRPLGRALLFGAIVCLGMGISVAADETSELNKQLDLLNKKIEVAKKLQELTTLEAALAAAQKQIALDQKNAADNDLLKAQKLLERPIYPIRMSSGVLHVIGDPARSCNALPFLRWQCNGGPKCEFNVTADICGLPGASTEPMELRLAYKCGDLVVEDVFPFNRPAKLSCN